MGYKWTQLEEFNTLLLFCHSFIFNFCATLS